MKCPYCYGDIVRLPPDSIDYCPDCELVTEGKSLDEEELLKQQEAMQASDDEWYAIQDQDQSWIGQFK